MSETRATTTNPAPAPRWAVAAAWAVPSCVLPSAIWRLSVDDAPRWYLLTLSLGSMALAMLSVGLVQRWGEWLPPRLVATLATTGATLLLALSVYVLVNVSFHVDGRGPVLIGRDAPPHPKPGWDVLRWYLPLVLWGPLLLAVARNHRRRHLA